MCLTLEHAQRRFEGYHLTPEGRILKERGGRRGGGGFALVFTVSGQESKGRNGIRGKGGLNEKVILPFDNLVFSL